jgi:predicted DNA-binding transcriptional regulator AlpA
MERLLTRQEVADLCGLSIESIKKYRAKDQCSFPREDLMAGRTPLWYESTIKTWRPNGRAQ